MTTQSVTAHIVRERTAADLAVMLDLWVAAWRVTFPQIDFDARRGWLTAQIERLEAAGAVTLCLFETPTPTLAGFVVIDPVSGWLDQICVGPKHFGAGYGGVLLEAAQKVSPHLVRLDVNADNDRAIRFYERNGFARIGHGANTLSGRPTLMMEWRPA